MILMEEKHQRRNSVDEARPAEDMVFPITAEAADDYEHVAAGLGSFAVGSAYTALRFLETGHSLTSSKPIASTAVAFVLSVGSMFFWDKSRSSRRCQLTEQ